MKANVKSLCMEITNYEKDDNYALKWVRKWFVWIRGEWFLGVDEWYLKSIIWNKIDSWGGRSMNGSQVGTPHPKFWFKTQSAEPNSRTVRKNLRDW